MKQLPLCVGIVCATAVVITMIVCKVDFTNLGIGVLVIVMIAQFLED